MVGFVISSGSLPFNKLFIWIANIPARVVPPIYEARNLMAGTVSKSRVLLTSCRNPANGVVLKSMKLFINSPASSRAYVSIPVAVVTALVISPCVIPSNLWAASARALRIMRVMVCSASASNASFIRFRRSGGRSPSAASAFSLPARIRVIRSAIMSAITLSGTA